MSTKTISKTQKTKVIQTRLPEDLVNQATEILDYIGLSATDAVRILFRNIVNTGGIPLQLTKPTNKTPMPKNPPIIRYSPEKTAKIEQMLDDYYAGKLKTTRIETEEELETFLNKLAS